MFDIYIKEVEIEDATGGKALYRLQPLKGEDLPKLFGLMTKLDLADDAKIDSFDPEIVKGLHELCFKTFKTSYPQEDEAKLDLFVSQNLMLLVEPLIQVNVNSNAIPENGIRPVKP